MHVTGADLHIGDDALGPRALGGLIGDLVLGFDRGFPELHELRGIVDGSCDLRRACDDHLVTSQLGPRRGTLADFLPLGVVVFAEHEERRGDGVFDGGGEGFVVLRATGNLDVDETAKGRGRFRRGGGQGVAACDVGSAFPFVEMVKRVAVAADAHGVTFVGVFFGNGDRDGLARDSVKAGAVPAGDARRDGDLHAGARGVLRRFAGEFGMRRMRLDAFRAHEAEHARLHAEA